MTTAFKIDEVVLVTGLSGGGKSTAIRALEDAGFFCIDNLPVPLLGKLVELFEASAEHRRLAVTVDIREPRYLAEAPARVAELRARGVPLRVVFLDASDAALQRRFSETRRRHPLAPEGTISEAIAEERGALAALRALADEVIDTSALNIHELKALLSGRFASQGGVQLSVDVTSFGFRNGVPPQADLVFDVRFLPNPHFVPELRPRTGRDPEVAAYVLEHAETRELLAKMTDLCTFLLPRYRREGKAYLTIAIGCTGGKHRSVALARALAATLGGEGISIRVSDRDADRE